MAKPWTRFRLGAGAASDDRETGGEPSGKTVIEPPREWTPPAPVTPPSTHITLTKTFRLGLVATLGVGVGILILMSIASLATVITYIGAAFFIALGLDPLVSWFEKKHLPRWASLLVVVVGVLGALTGFVYAFVPLIASQTAELIRVVPLAFSNIRSAEWLAELDRIYGDYIDVNLIYNEVFKFLQSADSWSQIATNVWSGVLAVSSGVFGAIVIIILSLYFTVSLTTIKRASVKLLPRSQRSQFSELADQITGSVGRYVVGQVSLALCNGVLSYIFLTIIGQPFTAVFALIAFLFSMVPLVGTLTGSAIIVLAAWLMAGPETAIAATIYYLIYMQVEAYVLSPNIMRRAVSVPGAVVVIAALAGATLLGVFGALIAIPLAASVIIIIQQVVIPRQNKL